MKEFLDWLKEECLPGIWNKGVQASRNLKSIERSSPDTETRELRFTMATPERALAFRITLWPDEQDAHCDCGSKAEPCHHIVAAALAHSAGLIGTQGSESESSLPIRLCYSWIFFKPAPESRARISLKRTVKSGGQETPVPRSLIDWVGGVKSGRIPGPLPHLTPPDLKLDELYARESPSWPDVLRILSEMPPIPVEGHPRWKTLQALARPEPPGIEIRSAGPGRWRIEGLRPAEREELDGGLFIREGRSFHDGQSFHDGIIGAGTAEEPFQSRNLGRHEIGTFLLQELPALRDRFVIHEANAQLPQVIDGTPGLELAVGTFPDGRFSVTARIRYAPPPEGAVLRPDPEREKEIAREARTKLDLVLDQPCPFSPAGLIDLRARTLSRGPGLTAPVDRALDGFFSGLGGHSLSSALPHLETIRQILELKENRPREEARMQALLLETLGTSPAAPENRTGPLAGIPPALVPVLREYQRQGVQWLRHKWQTLGGALLADDMGLGKTLQTLAVLETPALVVVPASLLQNWRDEARKFRPDLKVCLYHGPDRTLDADGTLVITTYSILRAEAARFTEVSWRCAVLDEAHLVRNPETRAALVAGSIGADFKLALTGTPIQNRRRDLLSLFRFLSPGLFEDEAGLAPGIVSNFILRRTKEEVLPELPPKTRIERRIGLEPEERTLYESVFHAAKKEILGRLEQGEPLSPLSVLEMLLRSRQVCSHPALAGLGTGSSSKMNALLELIDELTEAGQSVLVYSQWTGFLDLLEQALCSTAGDRAKIMRLDGSTRDRGAVVEEFRKSRDATVFLLSLHAGGVGLNLTKAAHVIFCEPWWNPFVELQAEDRAYRMGQEKPVTIHRFLMENTIEIAIRDLQEKKRTLGDEVPGMSEIKELLLEG